MNKKLINIYPLLISMGIMVTLMNFFNSVLANNVGLYLSGLVVHIIGLCVSLIIFVLLEERAHARWTVIFKKNPFIFLGGVIGAVSVILVSFCINKIGVFTATVTMIAGQLLISFIIDSNGWFGFSKVRITLRKKVAAILICLGIVLISM